MKHHIPPALFAALTTILLAFASPNADAVILYGKDNDANQTDPGDGAPWTHVGQMTNSTGTSITTGSAVYLGHGFILTANHVDPNESRTHITFDGIQFFAIDQTSHQQVAENVDLKVVKLTEDPGLAPLMLYEDALAGGDLSEVTVQVGWGRGRDPNVPVHTDEVNWGGDSTIAKRWGTNATLPNSTIISYTDLQNVSYTYEALQTRLSNAAGDNEAAMTLYDSGGALFQNIDDVWYLSGITTSVQQSGESHFGEPVFTGPIQTGHTGHFNYFARVATYSDDIYAVIPEPSTWALLVGAGVFATILVRRRKLQGGVSGER